MIDVAINGLGRIGRNFLRGVLMDKNALAKMNIVAINIGPAYVNFVAHMFKYDSLMGTYKGEVALEGDELVVDGHRMKIFTEIDPLRLPWKKMDIDWVVECSGRFTKREGAEKHILAGSRNVLISAPAQDEDISIIPGVNDNAYDPKKHRIVSLGSCTTNALLPMLKIINDTFEIERCCMTTVHAYTNSQVLLDGQDRDLRRSRAAALNIIPTTTGASKMVSKVIPSLDGKVQAMAMRVPVPKVSIIDLVFTSKNEVSIEAINKAFQEEAQNSMKDILNFTMEPLVSSDFNGDNHSVIIDGLSTSICGQYMGKAFGWYDNEWGYSQRLKDFLLEVS
jgi:glyceraldehyde 3-phosphate dehydrogenase